MVNCVVNHAATLELGRLIDEVYLLRREAARLEQEYDDALERQSSFAHDLEADLTLNYERSTSLERDLNERLGNPEGFHLDLALLTHHAARRAYLESLQRSPSPQEKAGGD